MTECIFCDIGQGMTSSEILYSDDRCFVVRDIYPVAPTHILVLPHEHMTSLADLDPDHESLMGHLLAVARDMADREGVTSSGFRLVVNQGNDAGQGFPHIHVHLLAGKPLSPLG